jgi:hypothetical protein
LGELIVIGDFIGLSVFRDFLRLQDKESSTEETVFMNQNTKLWNV